MASPLIWSDTLWLHFLIGIWKILYTVNPETKFLIITKIREAIWTIDKDLLKDVSKSTDLCICFVFKEGSKPLESLLNWKRNWVYLVQNTPVCVQNQLYIYIPFFFIGTTYFKNICIVQQNQNCTQVVNSTTIECHSTLYLLKNLQNFLSGSYKSFSITEK